MALHAQNRQKLLDRMRARLEAAGRDSTKGVILLQVLSILPTTTTTSTTSLPPCLALPYLSFVPPASLGLMLSSADQPCRGVPTRKPGADDCWDCRILMRFGVLSILFFCQDWLMFPDGILSCVAEFFSGQRMRPKKSSSDLLQFVCGAFTCAGWGGANSVLFRSRSPLQVCVSLLCRYLVFVSVSGDVQMLVLWQQ
jgi:hypothetical protein